MSLVTRQLAPVLDQLDRESLPNSPQIYIIGSLSIRGHTYGPSTISTHEAHLGDHNRAVMSGSGHAKNTRYGYPSHDTDTPPASVASEKAIDDGAQMGFHLSTNDEPPPEYRDRDHDWFTPGRLLRIFAPRDAEIHEKEFVLLDTKNKEGPGLLIRVYDEEEKEASRGYFWRSHVSVQNYQGLNQRQGNAKRKVVYLDEYEDRVAVPGTWIELEHTYNIPFAKYKCVDCGVLGRGSLQDLRRCYIDWLKYNWSVD